MLRRRRQEALPPLPPMPLDEAVRGVAACPCLRHQNGFVAALGAADDLLLQVTESSVPLPPGGGAHVVAEDEEVKVATAVDPDGRSFLQTYTDLEAGRARHPDAWFVSIAAPAVFRMAVSNGNEGLLVTASGADDAWAAVTADGVARLMTDR